MVKRVFSSCAVVLGLLASLVASPSFGLGVHYTKQTVVAPGGALPPYLGHATIVYDAPSGLTFDQPLNVTVEVDLVWGYGTAAPITATTLSQYESLNWDATVGGYTTDIDPTQFPLSYNTQAATSTPYSFQGVNATPCYATPPLSAAPYFIGLTLFKVHGPDGKAIPNAFIVADNYSRDGYGSGWVHTYPSFSSGRMVLGQGLLVTGDQPYPEGLASDHYLYQVEAAGYTSCHAYFPTGAQSGGQTVDVTMMPSGTPSPITVSPSTMADNPDVAPTAPTTTGGGSVFDLDAFFKRLALFFYDPATIQADLDSLRAAASALFTYGPLGLPGQIVALFQYEQGIASHTASNDAHYWYLPRLAQLPTGAPNSFSLPSDFNKDQAYSPTYNAALTGNFDKLGSDAFGLDLSPYQTYILFIRYAVFAFGWGFFLLAQIRAFTPELRL